MAMAIAIKAAAVLIVIGLADYLYQWWEYERNLKMSKEEIKQEFKQIEGGIRRKQQELGMMRMMQQVPGADAVITNPTHYAVAIKYTPNNSAPLVVAMGQDHVALKIKEIARENEVVLYEDKALARALFAVCKVGLEIPHDLELLKAVAEVLAYVYQLKKMDPFARGTQARV
jgi:flagellar biosynthetic protein FlhB